MPGLADIRDTDDVILDRELRRLLEEQLEERGSCLIVQNIHTRTLPVRLRNRHLRPNERPRMSIIRVAWAFANPQDHLGTDDVAIHICENAGDNDYTEPLCCNGEHLRKGSTEDVKVAQAARKKGFLTR